VWASGAAESINQPADDKQFVHQQLAEDFNITKIHLKAFTEGVLEWGFPLAARPSIVNPEVKMSSLIPASSAKATSHITSLPDMGDARR